MRFIGKPIEPEGAAFQSDTLGRTEPALPPAFLFENERLQVDALLRSWRSTKTDRGDVYLKRHWFEFRTCDDRKAVVYFDRGARREAPRWYLYTLEDA